MRVKLQQWCDGPLDEAFFVSVDGRRVAIVYKFEGVWMQSGEPDEYTSREEAVQAVVDTAIVTVT
jgi:hypothetical protein